MECPEGYKSVGATCPDIDRLKRLIRRGMGSTPEALEALRLCEILRSANGQLRDNAAIMEVQWRKVRREVPDGPD
jgi:hypothetical protein